MGWIETPLCALFKISSVELQVGFKSLRVMSYSMSEKKMKIYSVGFFLKVKHKFKMKTAQS